MWKDVERCGKMWKGTPAQNSNVEDLQIISAHTKESMHQTYWYESFCGLMASLDGDKL